MVALLKKVRVRRVPASSIVALTWFDAFVILAFGFACGIFADIGAAVIKRPLPVRETKFEYVRIVDDELTARAIAAADKRCTMPDEREQIPGVRTVESGGYPDAKYKREPSKWQGYHQNTRRR